MASVGDDRRFVIEQYKYLHPGWTPDEAAIEDAVRMLQAGMTREAWTWEAEKWGDPEADLIQIYRDELGRDPRPDELALNVAKLRNGQAARFQIRDYLANTSEALLRKNYPSQDTGPTPGQEDARDYLNGVLRDYGLEGLGEWAWQKIQSGDSPTRVIQDLRETDVYKRRFVGMEERRAKGLPAISEAEYIGYERAARQMFQAAGLPASFYDQPDDFARWIGRDVSLQELSSRVNDGLLQASKAVPEIKAELQRLYGVTNAQLAAFFLDPDRALPAIESAWNAAQSAGAAVLTGYGQITKAQAERLGALGVNEAQAMQGFGTLAGMKELFTSLPGENTDTISRDEQQAAAFGGDAAARQRIERRGQERVAQASGAQSFGLGQGGVSALGRGGN